MWPNQRLSNVLIRQALIIGINAVYDCHESVPIYAEETFSDMINTVIYVCESNIILSNL